MKMEYEWGPWIEHDGKGCPVKGQLVEGEHRNGWIDIWVANSRACMGRVAIGPAFIVDDSLCAWSWVMPGNRVSSDFHIMRYRVCRPRVTEWLSEISTDLPERVDA